MDKDASEIRAEIAETRADLGDTVDALAYKSDVKARMKDAVDEQVGSAKQRVAATVDTVKGTVSNAMQTGADHAGSARTAMQSTMGGVMENPLGLVGGAFALAFLAGLLLPVSDVERRRVGPLRDAMLDRAQDKAREALDRGKQVVTEAARTAIES